MTTAPASTSGRTASRRLTWVVAALALWATASWAGELKVAAAASLTDALAEIGTAYTAETGTQIVPILGSSSTLARQISEGAPVDVFLSADEASLDRLEKAGLLLAGSRRSPLSNTLVIVQPLDASWTLATPAELASSRVRALALAEPQTVPAGIYAKAWLRSIDLWSRVIDRVIATENVRAALATVEAGNADAAIVYRTDALVSKKVRVAYEVRREDGPPISYAFAALREAQDPAAAGRFVEYLGGPTASAIFARHGFLVTGSAAR
jgi:molybdate transport system substrate-binding protein